MEGTQHSSFSPVYSCSGFLGGSAGKDSTYNAGDPGSIPGLRRSLEEGMPTLSSILENPLDRGAWGLQSTGLQRVGHNWVTNTFILGNWRHSAPGQRTSPVLSSHHPPCCMGSVFIPFPLRKAASLLPGSIWANYTINPDYILPEALPTKVATQVILESTIISFLNTKTKNVPILSW